MITSRVILWYWTDPSDCFNDEFVIERMQLGWSYSCDTTGVHCVRSPVNRIWP